jgi:hypothetical protein
LAKRDYPEYVPHIRGMLKPLGVSPHFVSLVNDGISTLFAELEAHHAAAILTEGTTSIMPRALVTRPFAPMLPDATVVIGLPILRPNPRADRFARLRREEAQNLHRHRRTDFQRT